MNKYVKLMLLVLMVSLCTQTISAREIPISEVATGEIEEMITVEPEPPVDPIEPTDPIEPEIPVDPEPPVEPVQPTDPEDPAVELEPPTLEPKPVVVSEIDTVEEIAYTEQKSVNRLVAAGEADWLSLVGVTILSLGIISLSIRKIVWQKVKQIQQQ